MPSLWIWGHLCACPGIGIFSESPTSFLLTFIYWLSFSELTLSIQHIFGTKVCYKMFKSCYVISRHNYVKALILKCNIRTLSVSVFAFQCFDTVGWA